MTMDDDRDALAALCLAASERECTYCHVASGPCADPDGYHLARFLGLIAGRTQSRLVGAAAVPHGDLAGIVAMPAQAGEGDDDD
jgi:hypothetical protein